MTISVKSFLSNLEKITEVLKELDEKSQIEIILDGDIIESIDCELDDAKLILYSIRRK